MKYLLLFLIIFLFSCSSESDKSCTENENWIKSSSIEVYFSPKNGIDDVISYNISNAKNTIDMAIYDFTNETISNALILARQQGVKIRVYNDKNPQEKEVELLEKLENAGISVKNANPADWNENVNAYMAIMHNKFIVIDKKIVITGSYNFSENAEENNRENLIVIPNEIVAEQYTNEFEKYWVNP